MNNPVIYTRTMTGEAITLSPASAPLVASADIVAPATNADTVTVTSTMGSYELQPGESRWLDNCDFSQVTLDGTADDEVAVFGNTVG